MFCPFGRLFTSLPFNKIWLRLWPAGGHFDFTRQVWSQLGELLRHWQVFPRSRDGSGRSGFLQSWISEEFSWMQTSVMDEGWNVEAPKPLWDCVRWCVHKQKIPMLETLKGFIPGTSTWLNTIWFHLSERLLVAELLRSAKWVILMVPHRQREARGHETHSAPLLLYSSPFVLFWC